MIFFYVIAGILVTLAYNTQPLQHIEKPASTLDIAAITVGFLAAVVVWPLTVIYRAAVALNWPLTLTYRAAAARLRRH
ncbi:hypothetical protein ACIQU6_30720 [Streptomyces sp. NPDC090442]|uniref:hypothetical protein n=1 Tax=Streptomyces sp. NPDC090442 TaxID=3365962 RepID=UPI00380EFCAF